MKLEPHRRFKPAARPENKLNQYLTMNKEKKKDKMRDMKPKKDAKGGGGGGKSSLGGGSSASGGGVSHN